jgi:hypothetical protein
MVNCFAGVFALASAYLLVQHMGLIGAGLAKIVAGAAFLSLFGIVQRAFAAQKAPRAKGKISTTGASAFDFAG